IPSNRLRQSRYTLWTVNLCSLSVYQLKTSYTKAVNALDFVMVSYSRFQPHWLFIVLWTQLFVSFRQYPISYFYWQLFLVLVFRSYLPYIFPSPFTNIFISRINVVNQKLIGCGSFRTTAIP